MSSSVEVMCIRKRGSHLNPHERIKGIGGFHNGQRWYMDEAEAIAAIRQGTFDFYVNVGGRRVAVVIATHNGREYLKTTADGYAPNNLLSLPECPR